MSNVFVSDRHGVAKNYTESLVQDVTYVMVIPVWGETHSRIFLDIFVPSMLAELNLPYLVNSAKVSMELFVKDTEEQSFKDHPNIIKLTKILDIRYNHINFITGRATHDTLSDCHRRGLEIVFEKNAYGILPTPDCIMSENSLYSLHQLVIQGIKVVHMTFVRLLLDLTYDDLMAKKNVDGVLSIPSNELVKFGMTRFHPITKRHICNAYFDCGLMAANLLWKVGNEGLLAHCFHLHPILIKPTEKSLSFKSTIDDDLLMDGTYNKNEIHIVQDSDEMLAFEISSIERFIEGSGPKYEIAPIVKWAKIGTNQVHRELIRTPILLHTENIDSERLMDVKENARMFVGQILDRLNFVDRNFYDIESFKDIYRINHSFFYKKIASLYARAVQWEESITAPLLGLRRKEPKKVNWMYLVEEKIYSKISSDLHSEPGGVCFIDDERKLFMPYVHNHADNFKCRYVERSEFISEIVTSSHEKLYDLIALRVNSFDTALQALLIRIKQRLKPNGRVILYCFGKTQDYSSSLDGNIKIVQVNELGGLGCKVALQLHNSKKEDWLEKFKAYIRSRISGVLFKLIFRLLLLPFKLILYPILSYLLLVLEAIGKGQTKNTYMQKVQ